MCRLLWGFIKQHSRQVQEEKISYSKVWTIDRSPEVTRLHSLSPQVLDQVIFIIIMRVKWCAIHLRTCKISEIHSKLFKEYICLLFRWAASWIYESITHLLQEYPTGIHLLGKVMYQYYEDNYLAQICNSRNIIYIAGYISGRTEY